MKEGKGKGGCISDFSQTKKGEERMARVRFLAAAAAPFQKEDRGVALHTRREEGRKNAVDLEVRAGKGGGGLHSIVKQSRKEECQSLFFGCIWERRKTYLSRRGGRTGEYFSFRPCHSKGGRKEGKKKSTTPLPKREKCRDLMYELDDWGKKKERFAQLVPGGGQLQTAMPPTRCRKGESQDAVCLRKLEGKGKKGARGKIV